MSDKKSPKTCSHLKKTKTFFLGNNHLCTFGQKSPPKLAHIWKKNSGDLNNKHLNKGNIWYQTFNCLLFRCPVIVCFSSHQSRNPSVKQHITWITNYLTCICDVIMTLRSHYFSTNHYSLDFERHSSNLSGKVTWFLFIPFKFASIQILGG